MKKYELKNYKGITLIALVVTIANWTKYVNIKKIYISNKFNQKIKANLPKNPKNKLKRKKSDIISKNY